ncbi:hypothetical protein [Steroidobacter cummioxidans]|uniref:hypothetical protein n=1 Tax=Steroidobacter cummioxidans TaxID=1803913 RepID=UPI000E31CF5D
MFPLARAEAEALNRSQSMTGCQKHRDSRFPPFAFTEHASSTAREGVKERRTSRAWRHD